MSISPTPSDRPPSAPRAAVPGRRGPEPDGGSAAPESSRRAATAVVLGLVVVAATACGGAATPPPPPLAPVPEDARLYYDDSGGLTDSLRMVIRDAESWEDVWTRATARRDQPPPLPTLDFGDRMALVVSAGRMSPGDRIQVDSVGVEEVRTADGDTEEVLSAVVRTVRGCGRFSGDTYPVEIVSVRRWDGRVEFVERSETAANCRTGLVAEPGGRVAAPRARPPR